jgi:flagellar protein FlbD
MIKVTRLNGQELYVNADLILFVESSPETILTLENGKKVTVKETIPQVIDRVVEFKARCFPKVTGSSEKKNTLFGGIMLLNPPSAFQF